MKNKEAILDGPYKAADGTWVIDLKPGWSTSYGCNYIQCKRKSECIYELENEVSPDPTLEENCTQSGAVSGGKVSVFGSPDNFDHTAWYKQLFELNDMDEPIKPQAPKLNIEDKYQNIINRLYADQIIIDKNSPDSEEFEEDIKSEMIITAKELPDGVVDISIPFVYGGPDTRITMNHIYFWGDWVTASETDDYDLPSDDDAEMEDYGWFYIDDIEELIEYMFDYGIA